MVDILYIYFKNIYCPTALDWVPSTAISKVSDTGGEREDPLVKELGPTSLREIPEVPEEQGPLGQPDPVSWQPGQWVLDEDGERETGWEGREGLAPRSQRGCSVLAHQPAAAPGLAGAGTGFQIWPRLLRAGPEELHPPHPPTPAPFKSL